MEIAVEEIRKRKRDSLSDHVGKSVEQMVVDGP